MKNQELLEAIKDLTAHVMSMLDSGYGSVSLLVMNTHQSDYSLSHIICLHEYGIISNIIFVGSQEALEITCAQIEKLSAGKEKSQEDLIKNLRDDFQEGNLSQEIVIKKIADLAEDRILILTSPKGFEEAILARTKLKEIWGEGLLINEVLVGIYRPRP